MKRKNRLTRTPGLVSLRRAVRKPTPTRSYGAGSIHFQPNASVAQLVEQLTLNHESCPKKPLRFKGSPAPVAKLGSKISRLRLRSLIDDVPIELLRPPVSMLSLDFVEALIQKTIRENFIPLHLLDRLSGIKAAQQGGGA